jgi:2-isopropylmalate synthase
MLELYDTTLRDGSQGEGVAFSVEDKLLIIKALDRLGIHYIEGGYPGSNPKDIEFFKSAKSLQLQQASVVPFGSTRHPRYQPSEDPNLLALLDTGARTVTIFGKSWELHATDVLRVTAQENIELIESSVRFLVENGREVIYDAEHFFDGYDDQPDYALQTLKAAARGGARCVVLCDTNGGRLPLEIQEGMRAVMAEIDLPVGIHTHNDAGMGVANAVLAVQAGAAHVQGTFNGYGERCGNANLASIIPTLKLKLGIDCISEGGLSQLTETSRLISELANLPHDERQPYVGSSAFAHKGGMHIDAVRKNPRTFEHIDPELVGNEQRILISDQAGKSAILKKIERHYPNYDKNSPEVIALFDRLKEAENEGYQYEAADASFELLTRTLLDDYQSFFDLLGFRVIIEKVKGHGIRSEATIKVMAPDGEVEHTAADGDGPVNALDSALRKALERFYPSLQEVRLTDYKVRVLDTQAGTGAKVRVLIEASDGKEHWGTVGVSENIIQASWEALTDSLEYKLYKDSRDV